MRKYVLFAVLALASMAFAPPVLAAEEASVVIVIENHRFSPSEVTVPAGGYTFYGEYNKSTALGKLIAK